MADNKDNEDADDKNNDVIWIAAVEGGGTSFRLAVCKSTTASTVVPTIVARTAVDSSHDDPDRTLKECADFFVKNKPSAAGYAVLSIASFGPIGLRADSPDYGCILSTTPKQAWRNANLVTPLREACRSTNATPLEVVVETDVNAPAWAEYCAHNENAKKTGGTTTISSLAYITVGTGVGVGLVVNGRTVHGQMHPEGGHVPIRGLSSDDDYNNSASGNGGASSVDAIASFRGYSWGKGRVPYDGRGTVEGTTSSVALTERYQAQLQSQLNVAASTAVAACKDRSVLQKLPDDHVLWNHAAASIASLCVNLFLTLSVEKIVLGGGVVCKRAGLLEKVRDRIPQLLNGYLPTLPDDLTDTVTLSSYGPDAGLMGAIVMGREHVIKTRKSAEATTAATKGGEDKQQQKEKGTATTTTTKQGDTTSTTTAKTTTTTTTLATKQEAFSVGFTWGVATGAIGMAFLVRLWLGGGHRGGRRGGGGGGRW